MTDDDFFNGLEGLLRDVARSSNVRPFNGAPISQVDLVVELEQVARVLVDHCRRVLMDGHGDWAAVGDMLDAAAKSCRNEVVIDIGPDQ